MAYVFNPFAHPYMHRGTWQLFDVLAAMFFAWSLLPLFRRKTVSKIRKDTDEALTRLKHEVADLRGEVRQYEGMKESEISEQLRVDPQSWLSTPIAATMVRLFQEARVSIPVPEAGDVIEQREKLARRESLLNRLISGHF